MFQGLVRKLKAIPAVGVAKTITYSTKGCVERMYQQICVLVRSEEDEEVLIALTPGLWRQAVKLAYDRKLIEDHPTTELGRCVRRTCDVTICGKPTKSDVLCYRVELDDEPVIIALRPSEYARAKVQAEKVSDQHDFHVGWFKRVIRRAGLYIFG